MKKPNTLYFVQRKKQVKKDISDRMMEIESIKHKPIEKLNVDHTNAKRKLIKYRLINF